MLSAVETLAVIYTWITNSLTPAPHPRFLRPVNLLFWPFCPENCRKMKKLGQTASLAPSPRSANELPIRICTYANHLNLLNLKKFKLINSVKIENLHWRELQAFFVLLLYWEKNDQCTITILSFSGPHWLQSAKCKIKIYRIENWHIFYLGIFRHNFV